jgi:hypothetical protein
MFYKVNLAKLIKSVLLHYVALCSVKLGLNIFVLAKKSKEIENIL